MNQAPTTENIYLFRRNGRWMVKTDCPRFFDMMGTDTITLPFPAHADERAVLDHVIPNKPMARITIECD